MIIMPLLRNKKVILKPILKKFGKKREATKQNQEFLGLGYEH